MSDTQTQEDKMDGGASSETRTLTPVQARPASPRTPNKSSDRIQKDDSFKTCKTTMATPRTRRQLRMTPARTSILSGGKPFKEAQSSGKKFNSSRKRLTSARKVNGDDTAGSNETFIKCEQELMFDRDSLEAGHHKFSSTPKASLDGQTDKRKSAPEAEEPIAEHVSMRRKQQSPRKSNGRLSSPSKLASKEGRISSPRLRRLLESRQKQLHEQKQKPQQPQPQPSQKQQVANNKNPTTTAVSNAETEAKANRRQKVRNSLINRLAQPIRRGEGAIASDRKPDKKDVTRDLSKIKMPPPAVPRAKPAVQRSENKFQYSTPKTTNNFRKPASLIGTASRYLSQLNSTRLTRTQSFKSTAELEREYFNSLRSFH